MPSRSVGFSFSLLCFLSLAAVRPSFAVPSASPNAGESVRSASTAELLAVAGETDPQCLDGGQHSSDDLSAAERCTTASEAVAQAESGSADPKGKTSVGLWALGALALIGGVVAAASGGGSGGGGGGGDNGDGDDGGGDDDHGVPRQISDPEEFERDEYNNQYGLDAINASYRYSLETIDTDGVRTGKGTTGEGVLVAVLDTGIRGDHHEFAGEGKISDASKSYYVDSDNNKMSPLEDPSGHGSLVAAIIAANKDNEGIHGVAFDADLLIFQGIGLENLENSDYKSDYKLESEILPDVINTSINQNATVINNSWGWLDKEGNPIHIDEFNSRDQLMLSEALITSLNNASNNGMIIVFANGNVIEDKNDYNSEVNVAAGIPVFFPEFKNIWLTVAATDKNNKIASFSYHCGMAKDFCISAPGSDIYPGFGDDYYYGTSFAAPHVTGAVALLKHQFPSMGGAEIVRLIKQSATYLSCPTDNYDCVDGETNIVYGHGLLNLGEAMSPQGTMMVAVGSDVRTAAAAPLNQTHIAPMGPVGAALAGTLGDKEVAALDDFARPYYIPLSALSIDSGSGFGKGWNAQADYLLALGRGNDRIKAPTPSGSAVLSHAIRPCLRDSSLNQAYLLAHGGDCSSSVVWIGDASLSLSLSDLSDQQSQGVYSAFDVGVPFAAGVLELGFGVLDERESLLGSPLSGGFAIDGRAQTAFLRSGYQRPIASDWLGFVNLAVGETSYGSSGILSDAELTTWSWSAGLHTTDLLRSDDVLALSVKTPLAVSSGHVDYELPSGRTPSADGRQTYGLTTTRIREELGSEDVVPLDLAVSYGMDLGNWDVNVGLMARTAELQVDDYIVNLNMGFSF